MELLLPVLEALAYPAPTPAHFQVWLRTHVTRCHWVKESSKAKMPKDFMICLLPKVAIYVLKCVRSARSFKYFAGLWYGVTGHRTILRTVITYYKKSVWLVMMTLWKMTCTENVQVCELTYTENSSLLKITTGLTYTENSSLLKITTGFCLLYAGILCWHSLELQIVSLSVTNIS